MKKKFGNVLKGVFSLFLMIAMLGGGLIFIMFLVALILGGNSGASIALTARNVIMPYFIRSASAAVLSGLIFSYLKDEHGLSL